MSAKDWTNKLKNPTPAANEFLKPIVNNNVEPVTDEQTNVNEDEPIIDNSDDPVIVESKTNIVVDVNINDIVNASNDTKPKQLVGIWMDDNIAKLLKKLAKKGGKGVQSKIVNDAVRKLLIEQGHMKIGE